MKALFVSIVLSVLAGTATAQPPTAPAPREVSISNLTFSYSGPEKAKSPKVEMSAKDGKIEVRWTMQQQPCTAIAALAIVQDGVLTVIGLEKEPAVVTCGLHTHLSGMIIEVVLADGSMKVSSYKTEARK